jgi:hypothetical protein
MIIPRHQVLGLTRSDAGAAVHQGDLEDLAGLRERGGPILTA